MPKFIVTLVRDCQYSETAKAVVEAGDAEEARRLALEFVDPHQLRWTENNDFESETDAPSAEPADEDQELSALWDDAEELPADGSHSGAIVKRFVG
jgi:hypothetical protein